jgi:purine-binding chemotaxis protein CheW
MAEDSGRALVFAAGTSIYAIPIEHVAETLRPLPTWALSGTPEFVVGVSIVRGTPVPIIDVSRLTCRDGAPAPTRFVTIKIGSRRAALAVSSVIGVRRLSAGTLAGLPGLLQGVTDRGVAAIGTLDAELLVVLNATHLVSDEVWRAIDEQGPHA